MSKEELIEFLKDNLILKAESHKSYGSSGLTIGLYLRNDSGFSWNTDDLISDVDISSFDIKQALGL